MKKTPTLQQWMWKEIFTNVRLQFLTFWRDFQIKVTLKWHPLFPEFSCKPASFYYYYCYYNYNYSNCCCCCCWSCCFAVVSSLSHSIQQRFFFFFPLGPFLSLLSDIFFLRTSLMRSKKTCEKNSWQTKSKLLQRLDLHTCNNKKAC